MKKRGLKVGRGDHAHICWCCCCLQDGNAAFHNRLRKQERRLLREAAREAGVAPIRLRRKQP